MSDPVTHYLRNASRRPVEIHLPDRVTVLSPGECLNIADDALAGPAVKPLLATGALSLHRAPTAAPDLEPRAARRKGGLRLFRKKTPAAAEPAAAAKAPRRKARGTPAPEPADPSPGAAEASGDPK